MEKFVLKKFIFPNKKIVILTEIDDCTIKSLDLKELAIVPQNQLLCDFTRKTWFLVQKSLFVWFEMTSYDNPPPFFFLPKKEVMMQNWTFHNKSCFLKCVIIWEEFMIFIKKSPFYDNSCEFWDFIIKINSLFYFMTESETQREIWQVKNSCTFNCNHRD